MPENQKNVKNDDMLAGFIAGVAVTTLAFIPIVKFATRRSLEIGQGQVASAVLQSMLRNPR